MEWTKCYGFTDSNSNKRVSIDTIFEAGSTTKALTAVTVLHHVDAGKLSLDDHVNDLLVSWKIPDNNLGKGDKVTLRHLLTHTAGINLPDGGFTILHDIPTLIQVLNGEMPAGNDPVSFVFAPGILITIIVGFITALLNPLGIDMVQKAIIVLIFVITLSSALWIGTVISALLRTTLGKSARGRDMGKALAMLIILPVIGILYAFMGGGILEALADPKTSGLVKVVLSWLPSTWDADIINGFASNPGNITAIWSETIIRFGGLVIFFAVILYIGTRMADRAYSMEATTFTAAKAKPDGIFYKTVNYVGGGQSFGTLLVSVFKIYGRRFHNLSWLFYMVCLAAMINIFFTRPDEPFGVIIMSSSLFSMLAVAIASDVTIRGKETLFLYKKIPSGVMMLVKTRLIQGWLVTIPVSAVILIIVAALNRLPETTFLSALVYTGPIILIAAANMAFALGMFLLMPAYTDKGGEFMLNFMIILLVSVFLLIGCLIIFGETNGILMTILCSWLLGIAFLFLGKRKLSRME